MAVGGFSSKPWCSEHVGAAMATASGSAPSLIRWSPQEHFSSQMLCLWLSTEVCRALSAEIEKEKPTARVLLAPAGLLLRLQELDQGRPGISSLGGDHLMPVSQMTN